MTQFVTVGSVCVHNNVTSLCSIVTEMGGNGKTENNRMRTGIRNDCTGGMPGNAGMSKTITGHRSLIVS